MEGTNLIGTGVPISRAGRFSFSGNFISGGAGIILRGFCVGAGTVDAVVVEWNVGT